MTDQSTRLNLARYGAAAAALAAIVALSACVKPATNATNTTTASNTTTVTTTTTAPGAPVNTVMANPQLSNATPAQIPIPGGDDSGTPGGATGGPGNSGGDSGSLGDNVGGPNGQGPGGNQGASDRDTSSDEQTTNANDEFDRSFINSCFHRAAHVSGSVDAAAKYCTCVMADLDKLSVAQKNALTPNSPQVVSAENDCRR
jgi:hypothetical protein